jgi:hypothetical protein
MDFFADELLETAQLFNPRPDDIRRDTEPNELEGNDEMRFLVDEDARYYGYPGYCVIA